MQSPEALGIKKDRLLAWGRGSRGLRSGAFFGQQFVEDLSRSLMDDCQRLSEGSFVSIGAGKIPFSPALIFRPRSFQA
jgi:hypothetical protein